MPQTYGNYQNLVCRTKDQTFVMDPLSAATGVAGLLSLTMQVGLTIGAYANSVKCASKGAQKLEREIQAFSSVLKQLCEFLRSKDADHLVLNLHPCF